MTAQDLKGERFNMDTQTQEPKRNRREPFVVTAFSLPKSMYNELYDAAAELDMPAAQIVRSVLRQHLTPYLEHLRAGEGVN